MLVPLQPTAPQYFTISFRLSRATLGNLLVNFTPHIHLTNLLSATDNAN